MYRSRKGPNVVDARKGDHQPYYGVRVSDISMLVCLLCNNGLR